MLKIRLVDVRAMVLRTAMKKEAERLQNLSEQVARISTGLDMDIKASAGIDEILRKLRKNLKNQADNLSTMKTLAETSFSSLHQKDSELAQKSKGLAYSLRQLAENTRTAVQQTGHLSHLSEAAKVLTVPTVTLPPTLSMLTRGDALDKLGDLFNFNAAGGGIGSVTQGFDLDALNHTTSDMYKYNGPNPIGFADGLGAIAGVGGGIAVAGGIASLLTFFDGGGKNSSAGSSGSGHGSLGGRHAVPAQNVTAGKTSSGGFFSGIGNAFDKAGDALADGAKWVGKKASDFGDAVEDGVKAFGEELKEVHEGTVAGFKAIGEELKEVHEGTMKGLDAFGKELAEVGRGTVAGLKALDEASVKAIKSVVESKPAEYLWDMGGSTLGVVTDVGSFMYNVAELDMAGAGADVFGVINNFFDFSQDAVALFSYGVGAGAEALGAKQDTVDYCREYAEDYAGREGLAGELYASGFEGAGDFVSVIDVGVTTYKMASGIGKLTSGWQDMSWDKWGDLKDNLLSMSGWNSVDKLSDTASLTEKLKHANDIASNVELGYKYAGGLGKGLWDTDGLLVTMAENTDPGKPVKEIFHMIDTIIKANENDSEPQETDN